MKKKRVSINDLSLQDFEEIMGAVEKKKSIPLIKSEQLNMRLSPEILKMAQVLSKRAGKPVTTFLTELIKEDLLRIWKLSR